MMMKMKSEKFLDNLGIGILVQASIAITARKPSLEAAPTTIIIS